MTGPTTIASSEADRAAGPVVTGRGTPAALPTPNSPPGSKGSAAFLGEGS